MRNLPRISSARFLNRPPRAGPSPKRPPKPGQVWFTKLHDDKGTILPHYRSLLGQLSACKNNKSLLLELRDSLRNGEQTKSQVMWHKINSLPLSKPFPQSFAEMASEGHPYGSVELENVVVQLAKSEVDTLAQLWSSEGSVKSQLPIFILPRVVSQILKWHKSSAASKIRVVDLLGRLSEVSATPVQFQAINMGVNAYLHLVEPTLANISQLFGSLHSQVHPHLHFYVTRRLHLVNNSQELAALFDLFRQRQVPLASKGMSTFLRALYTSSDRGAALVINAYDSARYGLGFYNFLVKRLVERKDKQKVDWIFDNVFVKVVENEPKHIKLVLHLLVARTMAFEDVQSIVPVLEKMVDGVDESTWMIIFREFRQIGRFDKCQETLQRTLAQGHKLSLPYVGEYLLATAQVTDVQEFLMGLESILPHMAPVIERLGIRDALATAVVTPTTVDPPLGSPAGLRLGHEVVGFQETDIHQSWLVILYQAVLNNIDEPVVINGLFSRLEKYLQQTRSLLSPQLVDQFVLRLTRLRSSQALDTAEHIYRRSLRLKQPQPLSGRFHAVSLAALCRRFGQMHTKQDLARAVDLLVTAVGSGKVAVRGKIVQRLVDQIREDDPDTAHMLATWAVNAGAELEQRGFEDQMSPP